MFGSSRVSVDLSGRLRNECVLMIESEVKVKCIGE